MTHHTERAVIVHADAQGLAHATAARLLLALLDALAVRDRAHVCLTGGTVGILTLRKVAASPLRDLIDWNRVHLWWGDERFVPRGSAERNEGQAREAMIDSLPIPEANVHPMPASDEVADLDAAVATFADTLASHAIDASLPTASPVFDVTLLGVGPDGHVASLFPGKPTIDLTEVGVVGEPDSPKPPPARVSLTLAVLNASRQVWLVVAGADKAAAVASALRSDELPAGNVRGQDLTLWLLDAAAAQPAG